MDANKINEITLAAKLAEWFDVHDPKEVNFWNVNPVAQILKSKLKSWHRFKDLPRGISAEYSKHITIESEEDWVE